MIGLNQFTIKKPKLDPSPKLSYLLGALKGDACLYKYKRKDESYFQYVIQLAATDKDFVEFFNNVVLFKIFSRKVKMITYQYEESFFYRVNLMSKTFYDWYNSKTEDEIFKIAENYPNAFIKGVFDSEGSFNVYKNKNNYPYYLLRITTANLKLANLLQKWFKDYYSIKSSVRYQISKRHKICGRMCNFNGKVYIVCICNKKDVRIFFDRIGTSIKRKRLEDDEIGKGEMYALSHRT